MTIQNPVFRHSEGVHSTTEESRNTLSKKKRVDSVNITESKNTKLTNNTNTAFDFVLDSSLAGFFGFCKASE